MISLPKKVTKTLYLCVSTDPILLNHISVSDYDPTSWDEDKVLLCSVEQTFDIPVVDVTNSRIDKLKSKKQKLLADTEIKAREIDEQISSLLCIEHKS